MNLDPAHRTTLLYSLLTGLFASLENAALLLFFPPIRSILSDVFWASAGTSVLPLTIPAFVLTATIWWLLVEREAPVKLYRAALTGVVAPVAVAAFWTVALIAGGAGFTVVVYPVIFVLLLSIAIPPAVVICTSIALARSRLER